MNRNKGRDAYTTHNKIRALQNLTIYVSTYTNNSSKLQTPILSFKEIKKDCWWVSFQVTKTTNKILNEILERSYLQLNTSTT